MNIGCVTHQALDYYHDMHVCIQVKVNGAIYIYHTLNHTYTIKEQTEVQLVNSPVDPNKNYKLVFFCVSRLSSWMQIIFSHKYIFIFYEHYTAETICLLKQKVDAKVGHHLQNVYLKFYGAQQNIKKRSIYYWIINCVSCINIAFVYSYDWNHK